ncbi:MAG: hypothetical protein EXR75_12870 [Myxococcales bacterium]|nr:hypothetical protein [Myxococcales bacterium]
MFATALLGYTLLAQPLAFGEPADVSRTVFAASVSSGLWQIGASPHPVDRGCPSGMVRVTGVHVEDLQRVCLLREEGDKCVHYVPELVLREGAHTNIDVCMDRFEWPNRVAERAKVWLSFLEAEAACARDQKRLCTEFEWELGCEGPENLPWPYGWEREHGACNNDKLFRPYAEAKLSSPNVTVRTREVERLDQSTPSGSHPRCKSVFDVRDQIGNVEEWVVSSRAAWPYRSSLKGGYWSKAWSGCRGTNESHSPGFRYYETGARCCVEPSSAASRP